MQLYAGTSKQFIEDTIRHRIDKKLGQAFFDYFRYKPSPSEVRSWENSLVQMSSVLQYADPTDHGAVLKYLRSWCLPLYLWSYPASLAGLRAREEGKEMLLGVRFVLLALLVLVVAAFFVARPSEAQEQQSGGESFVTVASYYGFEQAGSPPAFTKYGVGWRQGEIDFFGAGAVLVQNQHYRQLHDLKLGRYDAVEFS